MHSRVRKVDEPMEMELESNPYNVRLFSGGLRGWIHSARFRWLASVLRRYRHRPRRVFELGCFDAKTLRYLPGMPELYHGMDANWDGGLTSGRRMWGQLPNVCLSECTSPNHLPSPDLSFDTVICMETFEHLPPQELDCYLDRLAALTDGLLLITVPNEIGSVFLAKWIMKTALYGNSYRYSFRELAALLFGRTEMVERNQHKGFDYRRLISAIGERFDVLAVTGLPFVQLPVRCGVTIGIVAKSSARHNGTRGPGIRVANRMALATLVASK